MSYQSVVGLARRGSVVALVTAVALALAGCGDNSGSGGGGKTYTVRFATSQGPGYPSVEAADSFAKEVNSASKGRIKVTVYPNGQLGGAEAVAAGLRSGAIQMSYLSPTWISTVVPEANAYSLPFAFDDKAAAYRAMDGEAAKTVEDELVKKGGIQILGWWDANFGQFLNNKHPINSVSDLHGLKMRVIAGPVNVATYKAWGAVPIPMDYTELPTAMSQGTVDGYDQPLPSVASTKSWEIAKYVSLSNDTFYAEIFMANSAFLKSLPDDLQKIVTDAAASATTLQRKKAEAAVDESLAAVKTNGMDVNTISAENTKGFKDALDGVYADAKKDYGTDFIDQLLSDAKGN